MLAAGFALIQFAAWRDGTPMLDRRLGSVALTGRVVDIDQLERGWRVIIAPDPLPGLVPEEQPRRVRIRIPPASDAVQPGDRISMRARLYPAPAQVVPGGWDLQRALYFAGIGAVGYSFGPARRVAVPDETRARRLARTAAAAAQRDDHAHQRRVPGSTGGVASALITGKRGAIAEEVNEAFRDSGLAHLLAISGLNLALVGGFVFRRARAAVALVPWVALRYPIKKIAAVFALLVMFLLSDDLGRRGPDRARLRHERHRVRRSADRPAAHLDADLRARRAARPVIEPESLVSVSFQLSFGAVIALIAAYEKWGGTARPSVPQRLGIGGDVSAMSARWR